jgi:osmotically-inducible protein OsmY
MKRAINTIFLTCVASLALVATGCSVIRGQESASSYVDDATITTNVKAKLVGDTAVDAGAVNAQTMHGEVVLGGFAKSETERMKAAEDARSVNGVRAVRNKLVVRPGDK